MVYFYEIRPAGGLPDAGWKLDVDGLVGHLGSLKDEARISEFHENPEGYYEFADVHPSARFHWSCMPDVEVRACRQRTALTVSMPV